MKQSPQITHISWGEIEVDGDTFKDVKLWPGGVREWDWGETGTEHLPGIQPADVAELLEHEVDVVVLSAGQKGNLGVMDTTLKTLEEAKVKVHIHKTPEAVEKYNKLAQQGEAVAALIHSTC